MNNTPSIQIAIADDHIMVRDSISRMIMANPRFRVSVKAGNGKELITLLHSAESLPDICILDVQMPEMNGYETMEYIQKHWPGLKVLVMSMLEDEFAIIRMLNLGAKGYIGKGGSLEELHNALLTIHEKGYYSSELMLSKAALLPGDTRHLAMDEKETTFLKYCPTELSVKEIARVMNISAGAAQGYKNSLFQKLNLSTRQGLAMFAIKTGIIAPGDMKAKQYN